MTRRRLLEEYRAISRENSLRFERAMRALAAEIREEVRTQRSESRAYFEALHAQSERQSRRLDDLIEENRAQRQALLRILDRLDGGGAAPAT